MKKMVYQKKLVAIGGGEKEKPNFLFIGHSQALSLSIQDSYFQTMKKIYGEKFGCECKDLKTDELNDVENVKSKIDWADIIYEGGGDTLTMIQLWKQTGFDKLLYDAWNNGKVICGVSAGACCWFKSCNSDSLVIQNKSDSSLISVDCLGWFNAHFTPHCDESTRYESTKEQLKENGLIGLMLSNCSAIEFVDDKFKIIFSESKEIKPYILKAYWNGDKYIEEKIDNLEEYRKIEELLKR